MFTFLFLSYTIRRKISTNGIPPENELCLQLVNEERQNNRLEPLIYSETLSDVVYPHTQGMINKSVPYGHQGFKERSDAVRPIGPYCIVGENVAYTWAANYEAAIPQLMVMWMNSPGHRANILGNFTHVGFAFGNNRNDLSQMGYFYGTQLFAGKCTYKPTIWRF